MIKKVIEKVFQGILIIGGTWYGIYFSSLSNQAHQEIEQGNFGAHAAMNHGLVNVTGDSLIPEIEQLEVIKDPMSGWNLHIKTKQFTFKPQHSGKKHQQGEGHAHLMINGKKMARLYSNWFHIPTLANGSNHIEVTLNTHSHDIMQVNNRQISAKAFVFNLKSEYCWDKDTL